MGSTQSSGHPRRPLSSVSLGCCVTYMTLLLMLLAAAVHPAEANATRDLTAVEECSPSAAFDALMRVKSTSSLAEFVLFLKNQKLESYFKKISAGKAILAPHNTHIVAKFYELGLANKKQGSKSSEWKLSEKKMAKAKAYLQKHVFEIDAFRKAVKPDHPCDLVAVTRNIDKGFKSIIKDPVSVNEIFVNRAINAHPCAGYVPPGKGNGSNQQNHRPNGKPFQEMCGPPFGNKARGLLQTNCPVPPTQQDFIPVGNGYDSLQGNPVPLTSGPVDPGLFHGAVFDFTAGPSASCYSSASGQGTQTTVSASSSAQQTQSSMSVSVGVKGSYGEDSFSANGDYQTMTDTSSASNAFTLVSGEYYQAGVFSLLPASDGAVLASGFLNALGNVSAAVSSGDTAAFNNYMDAFYNNYGTHYITRAVIGGIAHAVVQMSSSSYASLNSQSIDVSASATACYGLASGSVSASAADASTIAIQNSSKNKQIQTITAPGGVVVPYSGPDTVDYTAWNAAVLAGGTFAYPNITVQTYSSLITQYYSYSMFSSLKLTSTTATALANAIDNYMTNCAGNDGDVICAPSSNTCYPGSYGSPTAKGGCTSCYGNDDIAYYSAGNCPLGVPCDSTTGACAPYKTGLYANYWNNFLGTENTGGGCYQGAAPFPIVPTLPNIDSYYCNNNYCNTTTGNQPLGVSTATSFNPTQGLWNGGISTQYSTTWQLTGYFMPQYTGSHQFSFYADDCGFFFINAGNYVGAKTSDPVDDIIVQNAYTQSGLNNATGPAIKLNAFQLYPIRIQFGNTNPGASSPLGIYLAVNYGSQGYVPVGTGANEYGGYLYYNTQTVVCDPDGGLHPSGYSNNVFWTCGRNYDSGGATQIPLNQCGFPNSCANVGY